MGEKRKDLTGMKFGKWEVLEFSHFSKNRESYWLCKCDCGAIKFVKGNNLLQGASKSCLSCAKTIHGMSGSRIYKIWKAIKYRCNNKDNAVYQNYRGRGIKVCEEWENSFQTFYNWAISNGYNDSLTIDRINNNAGYSPENCRWATVQEQSLNRRTNVYLSLNGIPKTISQWSDELNINRTTIQHRHKKGWSDEECLFGRKKVKNGKLS